MAIDDFRTEETLSSLEADFGSKVTNENLKEFMVFCYKQLHLKYMLKFEQLTEFNGQLERRIDALEEKINAS